MAALGACAPTLFQQHLRSANEKALAINQVLPTLIQTYRSEGEAVIVRAATEVQAQTDLAAIRRRWTPVWGTCDTEPVFHCHQGAWPALQEAQGAWDTALKQQIQGREITATQLDTLDQTLTSAYCRLRDALPSGVTVPSVLQTYCERPSP